MWTSLQSGISWVRFLFQRWWMWPMFEKRGKMEDSLFFFYLTKWDKTVTRVKQVVNYSFPNSFNLVCCYHILVTRVLSLLMCFLYVWMISKVQNFYRSPCTLMVVWYNCIKFIQNTSDTPEAAEQKETLKIHHRQDSQTLHSTIQMNQGQFGHISQYFTNTTE